RGSDVLVAQGAASGLFRSEGPARTRRSYGSGFFMSERPQYGEYATPEEQRRLAGLPPVDATPEVAVVQAEPAAPAQTAAPAPARPWDRIITIALLAYGVVN